MLLSRRQNNKQPRQQQAVPHLEQVVHLLGYLHVQARVNADEDDVVKALLQRLGSLAGQRPQCLAAELGSSKAQQPRRLAVAQQRRVAWTGETGVRCQQSTTAPQYTSVQFAALKPPSCGRPSPRMTHRYPTAHAHRQPAAGQPGTALSKNMHSAHVSGQQADLELQAHIVTAVASILRACCDARSLRLRCKHHCL